MRVKKKAFRDEDLDGKRYSWALIYGGHQLRAPSYKVIDPPQADGLHIAIFDIYWSGPGVPGLKPLRAQSHWLSAL